MFLTVFCLHSFDLHVFFLNFFDAIEIINYLSIFKAKNKTFVRKKWSAAIFATDTRQSYYEAYFQLKREYQLP